MELILKQQLEKPKKKKLENTELNIEKILNSNCKTIEEVKFLNADSN